MPIEENAPAPNFSAPSTDGSTVSLKSLAGKKVILYFYPKDDTPGCTTEACNFRDSFSDFTQAGALIFGISPDDLNSHHKFIAKFNLPFPLLADPDHILAQAFGVWKEKSMYGKKYMGVERTTFLLDTTGRIAKIFPKVKVADHHTEVLDALHSMK